MDSRDFFAKTLEHWIDWFTARGWDLTFRRSSWDTTITVRAKRLHKGDDQVHAGRDVTPMLAVRVLFRDLTAAQQAEDP